MSDHNKCPSSEKEHEKCIFRLSYFHRIQPKNDSFLIYLGQNLKIFTKILKKKVFLCVFNAAPDVSVCVCVGIHFSVFRMYKVVAVVLSDV